MSYIFFAENETLANIDSQHEAFEGATFNDFEITENEIQQNIEEISQSLKTFNDSNQEIPPQHEEIANAKHSIACGPSPDREIEQIFANEADKMTHESPFVPVRDVQSRESKISIGTSPPPQSISTQVNKSIIKTLKTKYKCKI